MVKKKYQIILTTSNLLKISLICLMVFHLVWKAKEIPFLTNHYNGILFHICFFLTYLSLVIGSCALLYVFIRTIKQIFIPYQVDAERYDQSPLFSELYGYMLSYIVLSFYTFYWGIPLGDAFHWYISSPVFIYASVNLCASLILIILKALNKLVLLLFGITRHSYKNVHQQIVNANTEIKENNLYKQILSNQFLLIFVPVYLIICLLLNYIISSKGSRLNVIDIADSHFSVLILFFAFIILLLVFIRIILQIFSADNCAPSCMDLFNYATFYSVYYLLTLSVLLPTLYNYVSPTDGLVLPFIIWISAYTIINIMGTIIILALKYIKYLFSHRNVTSLS